MIKEWDSYNEFQLASFKHIRLLTGKYQGHIDGRLLTNGRKKEQFIIRKVRPNGTIKWDHRFWKPIREQGHLQRLVGHKFAFGTYTPEYSFLFLWGTEEYYLSAGGYGEAAERDIQLTTIPGHHSDDRNRRFFICQWWYPVTGGRDF